jgi:hypothetical protein
MESSKGSKCAVFIILIMNRIEALNLGFCEKVLWLHFNLKYKVNHQNNSNVIYNFKTNQRKTKYIKIINPTGGGVERKGP